MPRTDSASRVIAAPAEEAYAALVDPAALEAWLPPTGMTARVDELDLRPGGAYRMVLTYDDPAGAHGKSTADADVVDARFVEIVPGARVAYAVRFVSDDPAYAGVMTMTWHVAEVGGGTRVDVVAVDVPEGISPEDHATGMASSLDHLAAYLENRRR
ncbi:SRPBCC domain-containing protein [Nocardioides sp. CER19]|uniref:SRPBCC domain-containing protein n=1 Tax=Nocardioides sp. CER19 TaxID=3038538 RepID=UPI00244CB7CE|nr:SRPBCC domain-containing protein [Nocardioides sp. CER19]MDH2415645.1 SRPBCC domain-containing protein [Nocardioides sp. CER19]